MDKRETAGWKTLEAITGAEGRKVIGGLGTHCPALGKAIIEFAYGEVLSRPGLDLRTRELATISALGALGNCAPQLKVHIHGCLNVGCTRDEILETLHQLAVYAGFPAALNAVGAAAEVFASRG